MSLTIGTRIVDYDPEHLEEKNFLDYIDPDFSYLIKERGQSYYNKGNVREVIKYGDKYEAIVEGSNNKQYKVSIENEDGLYYDCDCPYEDNCKHIYAVFMAINNHEYKEIEMKPNIKEKEIDFHSLLESIPANDLKNYIISNEVDNRVIILKKELEDAFIEYTPKQEYEYYYNSLYNKAVIEYNDRELLTSKYIEKAKQYIDANEFQEAFKILKSIIEVYKDINKLNNNYLVDRFPIIGMYLRVIYRRCDEITKNDINMWINELQINNVYNNYYLEDMIYTVR